MNRNSSTSGSDAIWRRYTLALLLGGLIPPLLLYLSILIIDPYDSVPFAPDWDHYPPRGDHRHWNTKLLKQQEFDSLVLGTSTAMLLRPTTLNAAFGGRFVNLSMPLASPFEQLRILDLFQYHHARMGTVIVDMDFLWCHPEGMRQYPNEKLRRGFPAWLYDTNPWNDLPPFNKTTLKSAYNQARAMLGIHRPYERWLDGCEDLTKTLHKHNDPAAIRKRIYEDIPETLIDNPDLPQDTLYPDIKRLNEALGRLPSGTLKILFFPPFHERYQPPLGSRQDILWNGCKTRVADMAKSLDNLIVVDFLIHSPISRNDSNYIDGYHYTTEIATQIVNWLHEAVNAPDNPNGEFRILARSLH